MAKKRMILLPLCLAVTGCATGASDPVLTTVQRPAFPQYRPGDPRRLTLTTPYAGQLTQRGRCLGLTTNGRFATVIWPETARLSVDPRGLLLQDKQSGARLRLGDYLIGTGGPLPRGYQQPLGDTILTEGLDIDCARYPGYDGWIAVLNSGFRKYRPSRDR